MSRSYRAVNDKFIRKDDRLDPWVKDKLRKQEIEWRKGALEEIEEWERDNNE